MSEDLLEILFCVKRCLSACCPLSPLEQLFPQPRRVFRQSWLRCAFTFLLLFNRPQSTRSWFGARLSLRIGTCIDSLIDRMRGEGSSTGDDYSHLLPFGG